MGAYKADVLPEDLEDDQYIGELEEDDDGSYSEEWQARSQPISHTVHCDLHACTPNPIPYTLNPAP